jgi:hypothetical protein
MAAKPEYFKRDLQNCGNWESEASQECSCNHLKTQSASADAWAAPIAALTQDCDCLPLKSPSISVAGGVSHVQALLAD